jgi:hypothetical protein
MGFNKRKLGPASDCGGERSLGPERDRTANPRGPLISLRSTFDPKRPPGRSLSWLLFRNSRHGGGGWNRSKMTLFDIRARHLLCGTMALDFSVRLVLAADDMGSTWLDHSIGRHEGHSRLANILRGGGVT